MAGATELTSALTAKSTSALEGATTIGLSTAAVATKLYGTLSVSGTTDLSSTLSVTGAAHFKGNVNLGDATGETTAIAGIATVGATLSAECRGGCLRNQSSRYAARRY